MRRTNKDGLHYWEHEESKDKPFLLAIADFHKPADAPSSMTYTQSALWQYLYGQRVDWTFDENGRLVIIPQKIEQHQYGNKVVPSGFFDDPLAVNVSAVLFSNAGTMSKFDRMGIVAGFAGADVRYFRVGLKLNPDPNAVTGIPFSVEVTASNYEEYWTDEIQVFHNPNTKYPLPFEVLTGATHHFFKDGRLRSWGPEGSILSSYTIIFQPDPGGRR